MPKKNAESVSQAPKRPSLVRHEQKKIRGTSYNAVEKYLAETGHLTLEAFEDFTHDKYRRAALYVLARVACAGDVKALDLYFKVLRDYDNAKLAARAGPLRLVSGEARGFIAARTTTSATSASSPADAENNAVELAVELVETSDAGPSGT